MSDIFSILEQDDDEVRNKRVLVLTISKHLRVSTGIATWTRSMLELLAKDSWIDVEILGDKADEKEVLSGFDLCSVTRHPFKREIKHWQDSFAPPPFDFETFHAFQKILDKVLFGDKVYDAVLSTCTESALAVASFRDYAKVFSGVYVTHHRTIVDNSIEDAARVLFCNEVVAKMKNMKCITQLPVNAKILKEVHGADYEVIPLLREKPLYPAKNQSGVLWIGRVDSQKNPDEFLSFLKESGLPGKILTGGNGAGVKFEEKLKKMGITNCEVRANISGQEKTDFIQSAKLSYSTSINETFGYGVLEALSVCPTMILEAAWADFWYENGAIKVTKKDAVSTALRLYNSTDPYTVDVDKMEASWRQKWVDTIFRPYELGGSEKSKVLTFLSSDWLTLKDIVSKYGVSVLFASEYNVLNTYAERRHLRNRTEYKAKHV